MKNIIFKIKFRYRRYKNKKNLKRFFDSGHVASIKKKNRESLAIVENWMPEAIYNDSVFHYGIPKDILPLINDVIDDNVTYSDIMVYLMGKLKWPLSYLEIGVSAGKNLLQIASAVSNSRITGMDIEDINPVIEEHFEFYSKYSWPSQSELRKKDSSLSAFGFNKNSIKYLCSDEFDETGWKELIGDKYNAIFSDAMHTPEALAFEFDMLRKYSLLHSQEIILMYDDLSWNMDPAFLSIVEKMKNLYPHVHVYRFTTNGWINKKDHKIGIITTFLL